MTDQPDDEHPDTDRLADLHAGVLSGADAATAESHLARCRDCRQQVQSLEAVSAALAAAPEVGPLPEDVRLRLATALAATAAEAGSGTSAAADVTGLPSPTVVPFRRAERGRTGRSTGPRGIRVLQVAAAAVFVLGVGAIGYGALSNSVGTAGDSTASSAGAESGGESRAAAAAAVFPLTASGRDWSATSVRAAVPRLVDGSLVTPLATADLVSPLDTKNFAAGPSAASAPGGASAPPGSEDPSTVPGASTDASPGTDAAGGALPASRLAGGPALDACVQALLADATTPAGPVGTVTPLAVDLATWQQQPAAVILLPAVAEPGRIELWVVSEGCGPADAKVLYFADVAR